MVITYVYPNESQYWENIEWRCVIPSEAINRTGIHKANLLTDTEFSSNSNLCITGCLESDIIIIYKKLYGRVISAIHHWQARDKTILVDFDEAYQLFDQSSQDYQFWFEGMRKTKENAIKYISPSPMTQFKWGLKLVDGITVPTNRLASDWQSFNEIAVIPDYIYPDMYAVPNKVIKKKSIVIAWHGKSRQITGLHEIGLFTVVKEILQQYPFVSFKMYLDDDTNFMDEFENRFQIVKNVDKQEWKKALPSIDIGLVPLVGDFDQRQPDRSVVEYLVMKIPWIASHGSAFHELASCGSIVENKKEQWKSVLEEIIINYTDYRSIAEHEPYLMGIERSIDENIHFTLQVYEKFLQDRKCQHPNSSEEL